MTRRLFNLAALLPLLLFAAVAVLWVGTHRTGFRLEWGSADADELWRVRHGVRVAGGQVEWSRRVAVVTAGPGSPAAAEYRRTFAAEDSSLRCERVSGVTVDARPLDRRTWPAYLGSPVLSGHETLWVVHDWVLAVVTGLLPAWWLIQNRGKGE